MVSCDECGLRYDSRQRKYMHPYTHMGGDVYEMAWGHRFHILQPFLLTTHQHWGLSCQTFNVPLLPDRQVQEELILRDLQQILIAIGGHQFKVKIGVSWILRNERNNRLQFFSCEHDGECVVNKAGDRSAVYNHLIRDKNDMRRLAHQLANTDIEGALDRARPDTAYTLVCPTNMRYYVYILDYVVGQEPFACFSH